MVIEEMEPVALYFHTCLAQQTDVARQQFTIVTGANAAMQGHFRTVLPDGSEYFLHGRIGYAVIGIGKTVPHFPIGEKEERGFYIQPVFERHDAIEIEPAVVPE